MNEHRQAKRVGKKLYTLLRVKSSVKYVKWGVKWMRIKMEDGLS